MTDAGQGDRPDEGVATHDHLTSGPTSGPDHGPGPDDRGHDGRGHDHEGDGHDGHGHDHEGDAHGHGHGLRGLVHSVLAPHSHDSGESIASALRSSDEAMRTLWISLAGLAVTAAVQLGVVLASGSVALLADTIHNFADALTAAPLAVAFWLGRRAPTRRYTYGYGRAEDLAGLFVVAVIAASSVVAAAEAIRRLQHPRPLHGLGWVAAAGVVGFLGNELVALYRIRTGRRIGSAALVADGLHARADGITSLAVVIGAIGAAAGWKLADPVVGLAITVAILAILRGAARDIYRRLMDSVDPGLVDDVERVLTTVGGVQRVDAVRIRWIGHELHAEAEIVSDAQLTIAEGHAIAEDALHRLLHDIPRLTRATIHTSPGGDGVVDPHGGTAHHFDRPAPD